MPEPTVSETDLLSIGRISLLGCIKSMLRPEGWVEGKTVIGVRGVSFFRSYHHPNHPEVQLTFYYRGYRIGEIAGTLFRKTLSTAKSINQDELLQCQSIVGALANQAEFLLSGARVIAIKEKNVLEVQGEYIQAKVRAKIFFIDSDATGTAVREIAYLAPKKLFEKFEQEAANAVASIVWLP